MSKISWGIDPTHSEILFKVKHLVISTVTGRFNKFEASMESASADTFENASISFSAEVDSISTANEQRDGHLKSDDFFSAAKFPHIKFRSTSMVKNSAESYTLTGELTIRDVTQTISLDVVYGGSVKDPYGNFKAGFELSGKISRKSFGLTWDALTETGSVVVGDQISLLLNVQMVQA